MPRVRSTNQPTYAESPAKKVTVTIPLNDDLHEKAARLQSRKLLASKQLDTLKAAASPHRSKTHRQSTGDGPQTPSQDENRAAFDDGVTPMKRVPLLANFEEWMKMATDNKINAANSWNFALIDYFHDMSLLREGDGVNFQKASCTLDGCVKIYTSRVDSVATETGKLLSGLAMEGGGKKGRKNGGEEGEEEGDGSEVEGEEGKKKGRKKVNRSAEATLATSFESLRLKKMELEFSVDPLFKKAAADFDEGGAKGLLMNHLSIDNTGRIVFDSSDDVQDDANEAERRDSLEPDITSHAEKDTEPAQPEDGPVNISALASRFFPSLELLDSQVICPSLQSFELGAGESSSLDLPFLKAPENWRDEHPEILPTHEEGDEDGLPDNNPAFSEEDDDDPNGLGATFDAGPETGFGEGGEAWARDAALHAQPPLHNIQDGDGEGGEGGEVGTFDSNSAAYGITLQHRPGPNDSENILNYFDTALSKNWAGPEHWKIARIKQTTLAGVGAEKKVRKEKEPFEIDFSAPMTAELAQGLEARVEGNKGISLPRAQWRSKGRNLLPDDKHFNSKDLLKLFLKPKARLGSRKMGGSGHGKGGKVVGAGGEVMGDVDAAFWAANGGLTSGAAGGVARHPMDDDEDGGAQGDYDANFFQDDGLPLPSHGGGDDEDEGLEFADAVEYAVAGDFDAADAGGGATSGPDGAGIDSLGIGGTQETALPGTFGAELVSQSRRVRPEYVQYARTAKKVDVRRLKENMWRGMGLSNTTTTDHPSAVPLTPTQPPAVNLAKDDGDGLRFTDIMNGLQNVYPKQQMGDISTSYGFICLLHLANEKGLVVENVEGWGDLRVRLDASARDLEHDGT
ncbi:hypothetical protein LTR17_018519 [Elasticomyces elasticus]|nr:hypothetical protein LTR17_018519 [Elasticomyces elasticus]